MITVLTGAKKNIGDYLIGDRAKALISEFVDDDILELDRFKNLDPFLDQINSSRALILCGGPAYDAEIYPHIYPLVSDLSKITVPIIPFGLGWSGKPIFEPDNFKFSPEAKKFLIELHQKIERSSCRDVLTEGILNNTGIQNVTMTGCPVWYSLPDMGKPGKKSDIKKIVVTSPAGRQLWKQSTDVLKTVKKEFPNAELIYSFHRGIFPDGGTPLRQGLSYMLMSALGMLHGAKVVDVSFDLDRIKFYDNCDLHVGYRVHAHLYFLSKRLPSILINEDGRGLGMTESLGQENLSITQPDMIDRLSALLKKHKADNFNWFDGVYQKIDSHFNIMKSFLKTIK
jgi:hypothetical protein